MLEVKNLTFQVQENGVERSIVENISFDVADGEMLVITGPNGGGKSTLAKVLMGIEKASAGQIILDGEDISNYDINHRADAGIGYAFQQPPRFKGMTVMKLLSLSAGKELKREECCKLLSTVGLCANEYIEREVDGTLSGGEMKRLEIATVLAKSHKLCIFDEPEAGIDLWSFSMLIEQFEKIHHYSTMFRQWMDQAFRYMPQDLEERLNMQYMEAAQNPDMDKYRIPQGTAKQMLLYDEAPVYRLLPSGSEKIAPIAAISTGLWYENYREFAIAPEDLGALDKLIRRETDRLTGNLPQLHKNEERRPAPER